MQKAAFENLLLKNQLCKEQKIFSLKRDKKIN